MRRALFIALIVGATLAAPARAQDEPAERPTVTVPLPSASGVFYYRSGTPGGVRIRARRLAAYPDSAVTPTTSAAVPEVPQRAERDAARESRRERSSDGLSRLDLLLLEQRLLDAIDDRMVDRSPRVREAPLTSPAPRPQYFYPVTPPAAPTPAEPQAPGPRPEPPTPRPEPTPQRPAMAQEVERSILETGLFRTSAVHFEFARAELLPVSLDVLTVVADVLVRYPELRIEVGGHTDNVGSDAINDPLSQRRAESVADYLVASGVSSNRLSAVGYGERRPVAGNDTETGRALNRRVEFVVLNPEAARQETRRQVPATETEADALRQMIRDEIERARDGSQ